MDFTEKDNKLISQELEILKISAKNRCARDLEYDLVLKAFDFANEAHKGIRRRSGEPYIIHPINVARIVVEEIGLGYKSIIAALLHDVVEDTDYNVDDIERLFGAKIASLVDGLTKLKTAFSESGSMQAENFKRIILTLNDDVRVILIKLADRLHNVRTIDSMPDYKKDKILGETMYIFAPLAHRLGLYPIKSEMENIWFKTREPDQFNEILEKLQKKEEQTGKGIDEFIASIEQALIKAGIKFTISKRIKTPHSIWKKMRQKEVSFEEIFDLFAARIVFEPSSIHEEKHITKKILEIVKDMYTAHPDRDRNWIDKPKPNGYQAMHCTVMSPMGIWIEIQIRSKRMNEVAEKGLAAHWSYKRNHTSDELGESELEKWLDTVREVLENPDINALDFLDKFHNTLLAEDIYVFTPKGESKTMPKESTALDFAYNIHSQIGNKSIAAKANQKLVPLSYKLRNGDQIEIITADYQTPQKEWLSFLKSSKARNQVNDYLNKDTKDKIVAGRNMLEEELKNYNLTIKNSVLKKLFIAYNVTIKDELYSKIGHGIITLEDLGKILKNNNPVKNVVFWTFELLKPGKSNKDANNNDDDDIEDSIPVIDKKKTYLLKENLQDNSLTYKAAECCYPIPGDNVTCFLQNKRDIIVHKRSCPIAIDLSATHGDRIISAKWEKHVVQSSLARVKVSGVDRIGILNEITKITTLIFSINVRKITLETFDGIFNGYFDCYIKNAKDLDVLITHIKQIKGIDKVERVEINKEK